MGKSVTHISGKRIKDDQSLKKVLVENDNEIVSFKYDIVKSNLIKLVISNCSNLKCIELENIVSKPSIFIDNCIADDLEIKISNCSILNLIIRQCKATIIINNSDVFTEIGILNVTCDKLLINVKKAEEVNQKNTLGWFHIEHSTIGDCQIYNNKITSITWHSLKYNKLKFNNCFIGKTDIHRLEARKFVFSVNNDIYNDRLSSMCNVSADLILENIKFSDKFEVHNYDGSNIVFPQKVVFDNVTFEKSSIFGLKKMLVLGPILNIDFEIGKLSCYEGLSLISEPKREVPVSGNYSEYDFNVNVKIFYSTSCEGILVFDRIKSRRLNFSGYNSNMSTTFKNCQIDQLVFDNFDNKSIFKVINAEQIKNLEIKNSDLDNVVFRPLKVDNITIHADSFIGGMKIYGSEAISLDKTILSPEERQEFYRQLKQSAKNSNNKFLELEYKAKEMANYKPIGCAEWFSHWINSISNHGTDWFRPLFYMVLININIWLVVVYNLYFNKFEHLKSNGQYSCSSLLDFIFGLWIILNPLSRFSEFKTYLDYECGSHFIIPNIVPFLFFASKIINGILIYQMVSAFRKWVGKD